QKPLGRQLVLQGECQRQLSDGGADPDAGAGRMTAAPAGGAETSPILMPGGGVARRPLHFIVMADCSGSMKGEKMQALNYALRSMLPHLLSWEADQLQAQLLIRALAFATRPDAPVLVAENIDDIVDRLVTASIAVSRMSEVGADRGALGQRLLREGPDPGADFLDDSIL